MFNLSNQEPIIFHYKKCFIKNSNGEDEEVWRPLAHISIGKRKVGMTALIDTGSDKTLSYLKPWGELVGFDLDEYEGEPEEIRGLCGSTKAWSKHTDLWIGDHLFNVPIYWIVDPFDQKSEYQMILGRRNIFNHFHIIFDEGDKKVYFYHKSN